MEVLQKMQLNLFKTDYKDSPGWVAKGDNVHISLIVSSKEAIWGDDSEDLRFIVLHGELR